MTGQLASEHPATVEVRQLCLATSRAAAARLEPLFMSRCSTGMEPGAKRQRLAPSVCRTSTSWPSSPDPKAAPSSNSSTSPTGTNSQPLPQSSRLLL